MMTESESKKQWPGSLSKKDYSLIIRLRFRKEIEKRYSREMQALYKILGFGSIRCNQPGDLDWVFLESIISQAKETALLITSLVLNIGLTISTTPLISHLISMKLVAIFVIICRSTYRNNSNYLPPLMAIYLYFAGA